MFLTLYVIFSLSALINSFELKETIVHDSACFTQGLVYHNEFLFESCGLNGESVVKKIHYETNKVISVRKFDNDIFAEGTLV